MKWKKKTKSEHKLYEKILYIYRLERFYEQVRFMAGNKHSFLRRGARALSTLRKR